MTGTSNRQRGAWASIGHRDPAALRVPAGSDGGVAYVHVRGREGDGDKAAIATRSRTEDVNDYDSSEQTKAEFLQTTGTSHQYK